jgi:hypothetical protein
MPDPMGKSLQAYLDDLDSDEKLALFHVLKLALDHRPRLRYHEMLQRLSLSAMNLYDYSQAKPESNQNEVNTSNSEKSLSATMYGSTLPTRWGS